MSEFNIKLGNPLGVGIPTQKNKKTDSKENNSIMDNTPETKNFAHSEEEIQLLNSILLECEAEFLNSNAENAISLGGEQYYEKRWKDENGVEHVGRSPVGPAKSPDEVEPSEETKDDKVKPKDFLPDAEVVDTSINEKQQEQVDTIVQDAIDMASDKAVPGSEINDEKFVDSNGNITSLRREVTNPDGSKYVVEVFYNEDGSIKSVYGREQRLEMVDGKEVWQEGQGFIGEFETMPDGTIVYKKQSVCGKSGDAIGGNAVDIAPVVILPDGTQLTGFEARSWYRQAH